MSRSIRGWLNQFSQQRLASHSRRRPARRQLLFEGLESRVLLHGGEPGHDLDDHVHHHLAIFVDGQQVAIPEEIGIDNSGIFANPHTHADDGVLHVHPLDGAPPADFPTLDDFFDTWRTNAGNAGNNPDAFLSATQLMDRTADANHQIVMFVNGVANNEFENYQMHDGDQIVLSFEAIPGADDPLVNPVNNVTMAAGQSFFVPLEGLDPNSEQITYTVSSDNASVSAAVVTGGRSIRLNISGTDADGDPFSGDITLRLFEDLAPFTTARIIELVESGFYDDIIFHRIIDGFVAQGGDPTGTGAGGSGTDFADEFNELATFTGFGQLAMANSGDDTNDSQFFITDSNLSLNMVGPAQLPPQHLNFNHTIFGQLTSGFDVFERMMRTDTNASDRPVNAVVINSASVITDTQNGVLRLFAPESFTGTANLTVTATNESGLTAERNIAVEVLADTVDDRAFLGLVADLLTSPNTPVTFQISATDLEGDALTFLVADPNNISADPQHVSVSITTIDAVTREVTLTPETDFAGTVDILIGVRDQTTRGGSTLSEFDTQRITLTVNEPPTLDFVNDVTTGEDAPITFPVTGTDAEDDLLTFIVRDAADFNSLPPNVSVTITQSDSVNNSSQVRIVPDADFNGTVTMLIGVRDQVARNGLPLDDQSQFDLQTVTLTVNAVNDVPTAGSRNLAMNQDTPIDIQLTADDGDPELDQTLTFAIVDSPGNGTISNFDADAGTLTYTPNSGFFGTDSFTFQVTDEDGAVSQLATVSLAVNNPPVLEFVDDQATDEDRLHTFQISGTDAENDTLTFVVRDPNNFDQQPPDVGVGFSTIDNDTQQVTLSFTPNFNGTVQLLIGVRDQTARGELPLNDPAQFDTQIITLAINPVADVPNAVDQSVTAEAAVPLVIQLAGDDGDPELDQPITFALVDQPSHGALSGFDPNAGTVTYTSEANFGGTDTFTFTVTDADGTSAETTVTIDVGDRPTLDAIADVTTAENSPISFDITATDTDNDTLTFVVRDANDFTADPPNAGVTITTVDRTTRTVTITPDQDFNGDVELLIGVRDQTARGGKPIDDISNFSTQAVTLTVTAVNATPTASGQNITLPQGAPGQIQLVGDDGDPEDQGLTFEIVGQPSLGTITQVDAATGAAVYEPGPGFRGSDSFTFRVVDGPGAGSAAATVNITGRTNIAIRAARLRGKTLKIKGTGGDDQVNIFISDDGRSLVVWLNNNAPQLVPLRGVRKIRIDGRGGNDDIRIAPEVTFRTKIKGGRGDDFITGGSGRDRIYGGKGNDVINGGDGRDKLKGGRDDDIIDGGAGDDKIRGGKGNDTLRGGAGEDNIKGQKGNDRIEGGDGDDRLKGNKGNDTIIGGAGNDRIRGGRGRDTKFQDDDTGQQNPFGQLPAVTTGNFDDAGLLGERTDLLPGAADADQNFSHVSGPIDYIAEGVLSNPPTYGPHHGSPTGPIQPTGVYTTVQDDADIVHNLEHGHVWISYDPGLLSGGDISELQRLVNSFGSSVGVLLTPRPANDSAIALVSWARLETLDSFDAARIRQFAESNRGHAPEGFLTP